MIFKKIISILDIKDRKVILYLLLLSAFVSMVELLGIGVLLPFLDIVGNPSSLETESHYNFIYSFFDFNDHTLFIIYFGVCLAFFYIFRGALNLYYIFKLEKFTLGKMRSIALKLLENYMNIDYSEFTKRNSSMFAKVIVTETFNFTNMIRALLLSISEVLVLIFIYSAMMYVNYKITTFLTIFLLLVVVIFIKTVSKKLKDSGISRELHQKDFYEIINSTMGNFKFIKLYSENDRTLKKFRNSSALFVKANISGAFLTHFPKLFLETIAFVLITLSITATTWLTEGGVAGHLPVISFFVFGMYRLMPSINRILTGYNTILFNLRSLDIVYEDLLYNSERLGSDEIFFEKKISAGNIGFSYNKKSNVIQNVNLDIYKNDNIAIIGKSGSGKSTFVDVIIGLHRPDVGEISVDGVTLTSQNIKSFRRKIGYVPQDLYLFDGNIKDNIIFGAVYDEKRLKDVLEKVDMLDFLNSSYDGMYTSVGEGGVQLSGGQKQRIAVARALYTEPEILVLDEATSSLDEDTERKIMEKIYNIGKKLTIIIITHKMNSIARCNKIYTFNDGRLSQFK